MSCCCSSKFTSSVTFSVCACVYLQVCYFVCMGIWPACMNVHHVDVWCLHRSEEGMQFLGTRVTDGGEPQSGCWELNLSVPQESQVLLTTEPSLQSRAACDFWRFLDPCLSAPYILRNHPVLKVLCQADHSNAPSLKKQLSGIPMNASTPPHL